MESTQISAKSQRFFIALMPPPSIQAPAQTIRQALAERFDSRGRFCPHPCGVPHPI